MRLLALLAVGCVPALDDRTPYLDVPRLIAVAAEPAEVAPGGEVTLSALYAGPDGRIDAVPYAWSFCTAPRPLDALGPVAPACLEPGDPALVGFGEGSSATGLVPTDVCARFGPAPPAGAAGEPSGRPVDADVTGGFFQPALGHPDLPELDPVLAPVRVRCGLADVTQAVSVAWNQAYVNNRAPRVEGSWIGTPDQVVPPEGEGEPPTVRPGETVVLGVRWPACDEAPCDGAEPYVRHLPGTSELEDRREALSAAWIVSAGELSVARAGRAADDPGTEVTTSWTAPDEPGSVWWAVVLRDERGGTDFVGYRVVVGP